MLLSKMNQISEDFLGYKVTDTIITITTYFNNSQIQETIDAKFLD